MYGRLLQLQSAVVLVVVKQVLCSRELLVSKCFPILDDEHFDWTDLTFVANNLDYRLACSKYVGYLHVHSMLVIY